MKIDLALNVRYRSKFIFNADMKILRLILTRIEVFNKMTSNNSKAFIPGLYDKMIDETTFDSNNKISRIVIDTHNRIGKSHSFRMYT